MREEEAIWWSQRTFWLVNVAVVSVMIVMLISNTYAVNHDGSGHTSQAKEGYFRFKLGGHPEAKYIY